MVEEGITLRAFDTSKLVSGCKLDTCRLDILQLLKFDLLKGFIVTSARCSCGEAEQWRWFLPLFA